MAHMSRVASGLAACEQFPIGTVVPDVAEVLLACHHHELCRASVVVHGVCVRARVGTSESDHVANERAGQLDGRGHVSTEGGYRVLGESSGAHVVGGRVGRTSLNRIHWTRGANGNPCGTIPEEFAAVALVGTRRAARGRTRGEVDT